MSTRSFVAISYFALASMVSAFTEAAPVHPDSDAFVPTVDGLVHTEISAVVAKGLATITIRQDLTGWDAVERHWTWEERLGRKGRLVDTYVDVTERREARLSASLTYTTPVTRIGSISELVLPLPSMPADALTEALDPVGADGDLDHERPSWLAEAPPWSEAEDVAFPSLSVRVTLRDVELTGVWSDSHQIDLVASGPSRVIELAAEDPGEGTRFLLAWATDPLTAMVASVVGSE